MPDLGEACDDGNTSEPDCCSNACVSLCTETEPNGTSATADLVSSAMLDAPFA
jgi:hypothetical protein